MSSNNTRWLSVAAYILGTSGLGALSFRARHPARQLQTMVTFFLSLLPSELAPQLLAAQLLATGAMAPSLIASRSKLAILLAVLANVVSIRELFGMAKDGYSTRHLFVKAFREAGIPVDNLLRDMPVARKLAEVVPLYPLLSHGIESVRGIVYAKVAVHNLKLDVMYHPERLHTPAAPVFFYIHGGGWVTGHRSFASLPLLYDVARAGWLVVTCNYRLSPGVAFPEHLIDCKRALAWIRSSVPKYGGMRDFVVCAGESAGGHLAATMALTPNQPEYQPGFETVDTTLQGCVDLYGFHDFTDSNYAVAERDMSGATSAFLQRIVMKKRLKDHRKEFEAASPYHLVRRHLSAQYPSLLRPPPPFFVVHGTHDTLIPVDDSRHFMSELRLLRKRELERAHSDSVVRAFGHGHGDDLYDGLEIGVVMGDGPSAARSARAGFQRRNRSSDAVIPRPSTSTSLAATKVSGPSSAAVAARPRPLPARLSSGLSEPSGHRGASKPSSSFKDAMAWDGYVPRDVYVELPGAHHAFNIIPSARTLAFNDAVVDFLASLWRGGRAEPRHSFPPSKL